MKTFCSYFNQGICSSCTRIESDYLSQIEKKQAKLTSLLAPLGTYLELPPVHSAITGFRNKAKFVVTGSLEDPIIGLTGEEDLDLGRSIPECPLHHPEINRLVKLLPEFIRLSKLQPYLIKEKKGELKGLIMYHSEVSQETYLRLILRSKESLDRIKKHAHYLQAQFPGLKCLSANIQPIPHAILEGEEEVFITDLNSINHQIGPVAMSLHPQGFVQTNQAMATKLYSTAAEWITEFHPKKFMELFSGQGAFSFFIQSGVEAAVGVEINPEAVKRANATAIKNGWKHLSFVAADAGKVMELVSNNQPEVLLVNPPRRGLAQAVEIFKKVPCQYFIYSSCNAETLASDLIQLKDQYQVMRVQLFDMFPHTDHFETLVLLKAKDDGRKK